MKAKPLHIILGMILACISSLLIGIVVAHFQGIQPKNFLWAVFNLSVAYNTTFQVGVAANIGVFFLLLKRDSLIFWARGWMVGTMIAATVAIVRIAAGF